MKLTSYDNPPKSAKRSMQYLLRSLVALLIAGPVVVSGLWFIVAPYATTFGAMGFEERYAIVIGIWLICLLVLLLAFAAASVSVAARVLMTELLILALILLFTVLLFAPQTPAYRSSKVQILQCSALQFASCCS